MNNFRQILRRTQPELFVYDNANVNVNGDDDYSVFVFSVGNIINPLFRNTTRSYPGTMAISVVRRWTGACVETFDRDLIICGWQMMFGLRPLVSTVKIKWDSASNSSHRKDVVSPGASLPQEKTTESTRTVASHVEPLILDCNFFFYISLLESPCHFSSGISFVLFVLNHDFCLWTSIPAQLQNIVFQVIWRGLTLSWIEY